MLRRPALLAVLLTLLWVSFPPTFAHAKGSSYIVAATVDGGDLAAPVTVLVALPQNLDDMFELDAPQNVDGAALPYALTLHYDFTESGHGKRDWVGRYDGNNTLYFAESMVVGPGLWAAGWYTAVDVLAEALAEGIAPSPQPDSLPATGSASIDRSEYDAVLVTLTLLGLAMIFVGFKSRRRGVSLALVLLVPLAVASCDDDEPNTPSSSAETSAGTESELITFSLGSVWQINPDGSHIVQVIRKPDESSYFTSPTFSPDGKRIAYIVSNREVWVADIDTPDDPAVRIDLYTDSSVPDSASDWSMGPRAVHWSPDGQWLLVTRQRCCGSGSADIMLVSPDGAEKRTIVDASRLPSFPEATWAEDRSPDQRPARIVVVGGVDGLSGVTYDIDGREISPALPFGALRYGLASHQNPAGEGALVTSALGNPEAFGPIEIIDITGQSRIIGGGCGATWSPNGRSIAYYNGRGIVVQPVDEPNPESAVQIVSNADLSLSDPQRLHEEVCARFSMVWRSEGSRPTQAEPPTGGDDAFRAFAREIDAAVVAGDSAFFRQRMKTIAVDCRTVTNANQEGGTVCETPDAVYEGFTSGHWQAGGGTGPADGAVDAIERLIDEQLPAESDRYGSGAARVYALNVRPGAYKAVITSGVQRDDGIRTVLSTSWVLENGEWRWESPLIIAGGVLAEDFLTANRPETDYNAWERYDTPATHSGRHLTVAKIEVATGAVTIPSLGRDLSLVEWVNEDVIVGYDHAARAYVALATDGTFIRTVMEQPDNGRLDAWLSPERDGANVMVHWESRDAFSSLNVLTGEWTNYAAINGVDTTPEFSADGTMAYRNKQGYSRLVRDDGFSFAEYNEPNRELELAPNAWSPDSRYVLGIDSEVANGGYVSRTYRVYNLTATNVSVWERTLSPRSDVRWAGQDRLFVYQPEVLSESGSITDRAEFIDVPTGRVTTVEPGLLPCCILSFSPNGRYAVARVGDAAAWESRCSFIEVESGREIATVSPTAADDGTVFCGTTSWLEDSSAVLVSAGGT